MKRWRIILCCDALLLLFVFDLGSAVAGRDGHSGYLANGIGAMAISAILAAWLVIRFATDDGQSN